MTEDQMREQQAYEEYRQETFDRWEEEERLEQIRQEEQDRFLSWLEKNYRNPKKFTGNEMNTLFMKFLSEEIE
jgi:predicted acetyltransferase